MLLEVGRVSEVEPALAADEEDGAIAAEEEADDIDRVTVDDIDDAGAAVDDEAPESDKVGEEAGDVVGGVAVAPVVAVSPEAEEPLAVADGKGGVATPEAGVDMGGEARDKRKGKVQMPDGQFVPRKS